mmetsp:Transcript_8861/g.15579  ORF Transcript_8861/g.15579 Transcript_8861/m.15579 type:complete len:218 (-) Transcript_8861:351-1004(-)
MILKLQRAQRMRNPLDRISNRMGKVIHGINTPFISGSLMRFVFNTINHRIAEVEIGRGHVYLGTEGVRSIGKATRAHLFEELEIFFSGSIAVWTFLSWLGQCASILSHFLGRQFIDEGVSRLDEVDCCIVNELEVIRCFANVSKPRTHLLLPTLILSVITKRSQSLLNPPHILQYALHIFIVLLAGVGIVQSHVTSSIASGEGPCHGKVEGNCLGVS